MNVISFFLITENKCINNQCTCKYSFFFHFPERVHIHVYHTCLGQWGCHKLAQPWEIHEKETLVILQVALNPNILHNNNSITCGLLT